MFLCPARLVLAPGGRLPLMLLSLFHSQGSSHVPVCTCTPQLCCLALQALFELLGNNGYRLTEAEVKVFMPGLVEKCGQPQPNVRADCR